MPGKRQFCNSLFHIILGAATVALVIAITVLPAWAQNAVPPTAREAAASPAFASRLQASTPPASRQKRRSAPACSPQGQGLYSNGPLNGTYDAWTINFGYIVSNSFTVGSTSSVTGFDFYTWSYPGDTPLAVDWSITASENGGTVYGSGTGATLGNTIISTNGYGYQINYDTVTSLNVSLPAGTYWVNLQNAVTSQANLLYWDENDGVGCKSTGCPSLASSSGVGTIGSETFDINGGGGNACMPEQDGNFKVIYDFTGQQDGTWPSGLVIDKAGNLYGPTQHPYQSGLVYRLSKAASGWVLNVLQNFAGGANGTTPEALVLGANGVLYGAANGGIQNCSGQYCGFVFNLKPFPTVCRTSLCGWSEGLLYSFTGPTDAWAGGGLVSDKAGDLYGVSGSGGAQGKGAVFELTPVGGLWMESLLYSFTGGSDGGDPTDLIVGNDGSLFGATATGGANNLGVVFQLARTGNTWNQSVLYDFPQDSALWNRPHGLLQDSSGNLFGEYEYSPCCANTYGRVFMLSPSQGKWIYTELLHGNEQKYFGIDDFWSLAIDAAGNLYGTGGGSSGCISPPIHGYIFELTRVGSGWQTSYPVYWDNTIFSAGGPLALDAQGNLYGTTADCGKYKQGTVWQLSP